jgi:hypothetical protein
MEQAMPKRLLTFALLSLFVLLPSLALAQGGAMTALQRAQNAHSVGDNITALTSIWEAEAEIWKMSAMGVRNAVFVTEKPLGYGFYTPKVGEDFAIDEMILFYCEPFGFTRVSNSDGTYTDAVMASIGVLNDQGQLLGPENSVGPTGNEGYRSLDVGLMFFSTVQIRGLEPGSYVLRVTLTDNFDPSKSVQLEKPFNLLPGQNPAE